MTRAGLLAVFIVALAAAGVGLTPQPAPGAFPGANGKIAFQSNRDGNFEIYVMNADGSGQTRLTSDLDFDRAPNFSASGHLIVFERGTDEGVDIYVMSAGGTGETRIARNGGEPVWSPDGRKIAFRSNRTGGGDIYVMNADGTDRTRLTSHPAEDGEPAWSPDGSKIAFHTLRDAATREIYVMNADGSAETRLTSNALPDLEPVWSPDGTKIAFHGIRGGNPDVAVMNADGTGQTRLTTDPAEDRSPAWAPDGSKIAFTTFRDGDAEVYIMNADGSGQARLTANAAFDSLPDWAVVPGPKDLADLPPPAIGKTANVDPSGRVLVGVRARAGAARRGGAAQKGLRFVPLREARQLPVGSFLDTRRGRIRLQTAADSAGERQTGTFFEGLFQVLQSRSGRNKGLTSLRLKGASFRSCRRAARAGAAQRRLSRAIRRLRANARGRFRTRGRYSAATVRGTKWLTADRCNGTLTRVTRGRVVVRDFRRKRNVLVRRGRSYLARAPG